MKSVFGNNITLSLFGESHSDYIGITIHGIPAGLKIDYDFINNELNRRRPSLVSNTSRIENDNYEFISGVFNDFTTGSPLTVLVKNENQNSNDYEKGVCRPGQSDYTAYVSSNGYNDYRGGGHFSGRMTVCLVIAGAICKQILCKKDINISSNIVYMPDCKENDTNGGIVEVVGKGIKAGIGEPFFDSIESVLSHLFFSIPSVKACEFGLGKEFAYKYGSEVIDEMKLDNGTIKFTNNFNGGINGGISNGCDIVSRLTFKPISTILKEVNTINILNNENIKLSSSGRHDKSIINRVLVVSEAMMAIGLLDLLISKLGRDSLC